MVNRKLSCHPLLDEALAEFDQFIAWVDECMDKGKWPPGLGTGDPETYRLAWKQAVAKLSQVARREAQKRAMLEERLLGAPPRRWAFKLTTGPSQEGP